MSQTISDLVSRRFAEYINVDQEQLANETHRLQLQHRSYRQFLTKTVPEETLRLLFACSLSAPSKSDLQQVSIIHLESSQSRDFIQSALPSTFIGLWIANGCILPSGRVPWGRANQSS